MRIEFCEFESHFNTQVFRQIKKIITSDLLKKSHIFLKHSNIQHTAFKNYEAVFEAVRKSKVTYAIVNSDVVAYAQDTWNTGRKQDEMLAVVFTKNIVIPITIGYRHKDYRMSDPLASCIDYYDPQAKAYAYSKHRKKVIVRMN